MKGERTKEEVTYGGAKAVVWPRGDGRWQVSWGKGKSSTRKRKEDALKKARQVVREIAAGLGTRAVSIEESELLQMLYRVAGDRSPVVMLGEIEDAQRMLKGTPLRRAVSHWVDSGMGDVTRASMKAARDRFLDGYDTRASDTYATLKKELDWFIRSGFAQVDVCDLDVETLRTWIKRGGLNGEALTARTINNRHAVWVTFLNACRDWGYLPKQAEHVAELIKKEREPVEMVTIWRPEIGWAVLTAIWQYRHHRVPFIVLGCWLGLRPSEIERVRWEMFDWRRGYLFCDLSVAQKLQWERYVPIHPTARVLLEKWLRLKGWWEDAQAGKLKGLVGSARDSQGCSTFLRARGIIQAWPQDVMRHSCISYLIALGHSKAEIAEWSGNSEAIIKKEYRHPVMREEGEDWCNASVERLAQLVIKEVGRKR